MAEIRCSVSNCTYYGEGNYCEASQIVVNAGDSAGFQDSPEAANQVISGEYQESANASHDTCCETFRNRK